MMSGRVAGTILEVHPYEVHGQRNWLVRWRPDGAPGGAVKEARLAAESMPPDPVPGERVQVDLLMGEATEMRRA